MDGNIIKSADLCGRIVDWSKHTYLATNTEFVGVTGLTLSKSGLLATLGLTGKVLEIEAKKSFSTPANSLAQSSFGDFLIIVSPDSVTVYNPSNGTRISMLGIPKITCACIRGNLVYLGTEEKSIRMVQVDDSGKLAATEFELKGNTGTIAALAVDPEGKFIAAGDNQRRIQLYDLSEKSVWPILLNFDSIDDCYQMVFPHLYGQLLSLVA